MIMKRTNIYVGDSSTWLRVQLYKQISNFPSLCCPFPVFRSYKQNSQLQQLFKINTVSAHSDPDHYENNCCCCCCCLSCTHDQLTVNVKEHLRKYVKSHGFLIETCSKRFSYKYKVSFICTLNLSHRFVQCLSCHQLSKYENVNTCFRPSWLADDAMHA